VRTKFIVFVAVVAGAVAIIAWRERRFASRAGQTRTALSADDAKNAAALRVAKTRLAAVEKERAELQATLDSLAKTRPVKTVASAKKTNPASASQVAEWLKGEEERQKDPQVQLRQLAAARTRLRARYGALYWKLKLTPEQIEQFETIAARKAEQDADLMAAVQAQGVGVNDADFGKLYTPMHMKNEDAYRAAAKELLGEAGYQQFNDYERQLSARSHVQAVAGAAVLAGTPFSPQQAEQLVSVLANASASYRQGRNAQPLDIDWDQVDARACEILSPGQLTGFQTLEPSTGDQGRFGLQFSRALDEAQRAERNQATAATKPTGGE
jgi:hypothetical protein